MPPPEQRQAPGGDSVVNPLSKQDAVAPEDSGFEPADLHPRFPRDTALYKQLLEAEKISLCGRQLSLQTRINLASLLSLVPLVVTIGLSLRQLLSKVFFFDGCRRSIGEDVAFDTCYRCNGNSTQLSLASVTAANLDKTLLYSIFAVVALVYITFSTLSRLFKARHRAFVLLSHGVYTTSGGNRLRALLSVLGIAVFIFYFQNQMAQDEQMLVALLYLTNPAGDPACSKLQPTFRPTNPTRPHMDTTSSLFAVILCFVPFYPVLKSMVELSQKPFKAVKLKLMLGSGAGRGIDATTLAVRVADLKKAAVRALKERRQRPDKRCARWWLSRRQEATYLYGKLRGRSVRPSPTLEDFTITWATTEREVSRVLEDLEKRGKLYKMKGEEKAGEDLAMQML